MRGTDGYDTPASTPGTPDLGGVASLLALLLVAVAQPWAGAPRLQVVVHEGRMSVDLWEVDLGEVLAQIHQQTGISFRVSPSPAQTLRIQFTDVALDQGLRRLLQLASRSYAMHYAPGPTGEFALQEVQVFTEAPAGKPKPVRAAQAGEMPGGGVGRRFVEAMTQHQAAAPVVTDEAESAAASRFHEALVHYSALALGETDAPASDAARRFADALKGLTGATQR
jgi:hypothetical protein